MKKFLLFTFYTLIALLSAGCSKDETPGFGSIYGIVTDADNNEPVRGASVILSPGNLSTTTGNSGNYEFTDLEPGSYKIQVRATDYETASRQIQISAGVRSTGDITMIPEDKITGIGLSSTVLDFDTNFSELTISLRNTGNVGSISWSISGIDVTWLSVSPQQGTTEMGKSSEIKVSVDRSKVTSTTSTTFIVNAAGGSQSVTVLVSAQQSDDDDVTDTPQIQLSNSTLDFGTNYSEKTLMIYNTGNTSSVPWYITGIQVSWLSITPLQGSATTGKASEIKVSVDRSKITTSCSTTFNVYTANGSHTVTVKVTPQSSGGTTTEDYSSATITSCDYRVAAKIVSCKRSGTSVVFTYTLTNNGLGNVNDWRIYPPSSMSLISGGTRSVITDNTGKEYPYPTMTFRSSSTTGSNIINTSFPENIACQGTVTLKDVPSSATKITALIGVYAYPNTTYNMTDSKVTFSNVPVY